MAEAQYEKQTRRPDGTLRPVVKVKPGYIPPDEQERYSSKFASSGPAGIPGADEPDPAALAAAARAKQKAKNDRRKERKRQERLEGADEVSAGGGADAAAPPPAAEPAPEPAEGSSGGGTGEVERKLKALKKKLKQVEDLETKAADGATLNADQLAKVAAKGDVEAEIAKWEALGDMDVGKKIKAIKKKVRQIEELEEKMKSGCTLNEDQAGKVAAKAEVLRELSLLEALS